MAAYSILEAKSNLAALVDRATNGEEVVIAEVDKPALKLVLVDDSSARPEFRRPAPGFAKGEFRELLEELDRAWPEDIQRSLGMIG